VALEAIRGSKAISGLAKQFRVHPNQITLWKKQLLSGAELVIEGTAAKSAQSDEPEVVELYERSCPFPL
jgi:transposase-like protein